MTGAGPTCQLTIKAVPNAPRTEVAGWMGDTLKLKLHAPPVDGKANAELCRYLADALGLPRSAIRVVTGETARVKRVQLIGLSLDAVRVRLDGQVSP